MDKLRPKELLLNGFLLWLIPFLVSFFIYPLRETNRGLFESIMPLTITVVVIFLSIRFFSKSTYTAKEGLLVGFIWLLISVAIDAVMFIFGPIQMSLTEYVQDIGLTYFIIPMITAGYADNKKKVEEKS